MTSPLAPQPRLVRGGVGTGGSLITRRRLTRRWCPTQTACASACTVLFRRLVLRCGQLPRCARFDRVRHRYLRVAFFRSRRSPSLNRLLGDRRTRSCRHDSCKHPLRAVHGLIRGVVCLHLFTAAACPPRRAASASFIIRSTSSLLRPLEAVIVIFVPFPVPRSFADTLTMPLASMSNVTSIWGTPRGAAGSPTRWNLPSVRLSRAIGRSPCRTCTSTLV